MDTELNDVNDNTDTTDATNTRKDVIEAVEVIVTKMPEKGWIGEIYDRLVSLGVTPVVADAYIIGYAINSVKNHVCTIINNDVIDDRLHEAVIDSICGTILRDKHTFGSLDLDALNMDGVSSIREGDVTINFTEKGSSSVMNQIESMINKDGEFLCYRKLRW